MYAESTFKAIFGTLVVVFGAIRMYYARAARLARGRERVVWREGRRHTLARALLALGGLIPVGAYFGGARWIGRATIPLSARVRWSGAAIAAGGLVGLVAIHRALGRNFSTTLHLGERQTLVTTGAYRWVRHPLYSVLILVLLGLSLLAANWLIGFPWLGGLALIIATRVPKEEALLIEWFGDEYRAYMRRSGRFLPPLRKTSG